MTFTVDVAHRVSTAPRSLLWCAQDDVIYALTGVPAGLSFDPNTRHLSGTPQGIGSVHLCTIAHTSASLG